MKSYLEFNRLIVLPQAYCQVQIQRKPQVEIQILSDTDTKYEEC